MTKAKKIKNEKMDALVQRVGVPYFMMCVSHLLDVGYRAMTEENVKHTIESIKTRDDENNVMSNDFTIFIVEAAYEISRELQPIELIRYTAKLLK